MSASSEGGVGGAVGGGVGTATTTAPGMYFKRYLLSIYVHTIIHICLCVHR